MTVLLGLIAIVMLWMFERILRHTNDPDRRDG